MMVFTRLAGGTAWTAAGRVPGTIVTVSSHHVLTAADFVL